jgi:hypothetical protein
VRRETQGDQSPISPIRGCTQLLEENHFEEDRILYLRWISQVAHVDGRATAIGARIRAGVVGHALYYELHKPGDWSVFV